MSVIDQRCIPREIAILIGRATSWEEVAMLEKAHLGFVTYATYTRLTVHQRAKIGRMNQTTVRQKLRLP